MWNGSVTRIGYAIKDPLNFGQSTKGILAETAKKYHDSLDDCEIQILDAKWYLENQLAQNKARREEAQLREQGVTSTKRKHDEIRDVEDGAGRTEDNNASKRVKVEGKKSDEVVVIDEQPRPVSTPKESTPARAVPAPVPPAAAAPEKPVAIKAEEPLLPIVEESKKAPAKSKPPPENKTEQLQDVAHPLGSQKQFSLDDYSKPTPQESPTRTNDFTFESMFGEPTADMGDGGGDDLGFDLSMENNDPFANISQDGSNMNIGANMQETNNPNPPDQSSLSSLLPGLESYANQAGDDAFTNMSQNPASSNINNANVNPFDANPAQSTDNNFGLPELGGANEFDEFFESNEFDNNAHSGGGGGTIGNDSGGNFNFDEYELSNMDDYNFEDLK